MKNLLIVLSRDYSKEMNSGRKTIVNNYLKYLPEVCNLSTVIAKNPFERNVFNLFLLLPFTLFISVFSKYPFQALAYKILNRNILKDLEFDNVLFDGERLALLASEVEPEIVIIDFDDVLSLRYGSMASKGAISFGSLGSALAKYHKIMPKSFFQKLLGTENKKLAHLESTIMRRYSKVVFSSNSEKELLVTKYSFNGAAFQQSIPYERKTHISYERDEMVYGFIGGDSVPQNKTAICFLVDFWNRNKIKSKLIFAGKIDDEYEHPDNVNFMGVVDTVDEFYSKINVLICPSFVEGGVKTKVIESAIFGIPVIGNEVTFDSVELPVNYPLVYKNELELLEILNNLNDKNLNSVEIFKALEAIAKYHSKEKYLSIYRGLL